MRGSIDLDSVHDVVYIGKVGGLAANSDQSMVEPCMLLRWFS